MIESQLAALNTLLDRAAGLLWFGVPLALVLAGLRLLFGDRWKGRRGERRVARAIGRRPALHDLLLPAGRGGDWTQIDHVVRLRTAIVCIETKSKDGLIFGRREEPSWTQRLGRSSYAFQNPLRQNYGHVKAVEAALAARGRRAPVLPLVVFAGGARFPDGMPAGCCPLSGLGAALKRLEAESGGDVSDADWAAILAARSTRAADRTAHLKALRARFAGDARRRIGLGSIAAGLLAVLWLLAAGR